MRTPDKYCHSVPVNAKAVVNILILNSIQLLVQ